MLMRNNLLVSSRHKIHLGGWGAMVIYLIIYLFSLDLFNLDAFLKKELLLQAFSVYLLGFLCPDVKSNEPLMI